MKIDQDTARRINDLIASELEGHAMAAALDAIRAITETDPSCDWGYCSDVATETYGNSYEVRPFCSKHGAWNRAVLISGRFA